MIKKESKIPTEEGLKRVQLDDGIIGTFVYAPISRRLTRLLSGTNVTPNQVTVTHFVLIIIASGLFSTGNYVWFILGGIILQLSYVLDLVDGELSRLKNLQSRLGAFLDPVLDRIGEYILYFGICFGLYRQLNVTWIWMLGFFVIATVFMINYSWGDVHKEKHVTLASDILRKRVERTLGGLLKIKSSYFRFASDAHFFLIFLGAIFNAITPRDALNSMIIVLFIIGIIGTAYWIGLFFGCIKNLRSR